MYFEIPGRGRDASESIFLGDVNINRDVAAFRQIERLFRNENAFGDARFDAAHGLAQRARARGSCSARHSATLLWDINRARLGLRICCVGFCHGTAVESDVRQPVGIAILLAGHVFDGESIQGRAPVSSRARARASGPGSSLCSGLASAGREVRNRCECAARRCRGSRRNPTRRAARNIRPRCSSRGRDSFASSSTTFPEGSRKTTA